MNQGIIHDWLKAAARFPLLTAEQEIVLAHQIQRGQAEGATPQQQRIGARAKQKMIQSNMRLVVTIGKKFRITTKTCPAINLEDLLQEGCLGLNRAAEKFDPTTGYKFSTYAFWWITQAMSRMIDMQQSTIRLPSQVSASIKRIRRAPHSITSRAELQKWLEASNSQMKMIEQGLLLRQMKSLDFVPTTDNGEGTPLAGLVPDQSNQTTLDQLDWELAAEALDAVLDPEDPRTKMLKRRAIDGEKFKDIAADQPVNRESVRQRISSLINEKQEQLSHLREFLAA